MISGRNIICFASGYDAPPTSKHHVMHLLAQTNNVLWVNYHASRTPSANLADASWMLKKIRKVFAGPQRPRPRLTVLTPLVLPLPSSSLARSLNSMLLVRQVRKVLLTLEAAPVQVWSFTPDIAYALGHFGEERVVYYCVDDFANFSGYDTTQVLEDERQLCQRADLVVTTSCALQESKKHLNPNTIMVAHGVDFDHFSRAVTQRMPAPPELDDIPKPRIGFFGLIRDWVDLDLIAEVARRQRGWQFVFIGDSAVDLTPYANVHNMHFVGAKPYNDLPAWCRHMQAGLIPFRINDLTRAVNPIKMREYLAAGLAVISTPLPEARRFEPMVRIGTNALEFERAIAESLTLPEEHRFMRMKAMEEQRWPAKVAAICEALEVHVPSHASCTQTTSRQA